MQNVENDMDDLFRKAVRHYSLRPCESEWDDLATRLQNNSIRLSDGTIYFTLKKKVSILLFMLGIIVAVLIPVNYLNPNEVINRESVIKNSVDRNIIKIAGKPAHRQRHESFNWSENISQLKQVSYGPGEQFSNEMGNSLTKTVEIKVANLRGKINTAQFDSLAIVHSILLGMNLQNHGLIEFSNRIQSCENISLQKLAAVPNRGFYFGVVFGPLLSQVRHHEFTKAGFDFGLTVGYKIDKKFSVETGLLKTMEYYFVGGKYYSIISRVPNVDNLQGNRKAFQIAVNLKYNVLHLKSANLFISAGLTSYVGVKEKTVINVGNSSLQPPQGLDYGSASYLPSYLNVALGYEFKIGKRTNIRVEPYSQIPLESQIGNTINKELTGGALQFFNAGVHIGMTRFFL